MSPLSLCKGTIKSPCWSECSRSKKLVAAAASCAPRGTDACRHDKPGAFRLLCTSPSFRTNSRGMQWAIKTTVDDSTDQSGHSTRLFSAIQSFWNKLSGKLKKVRKGLPVKILFFLIGFYCATAFATVIGQTGD